MELPEIVEREDARWLVDRDECDPRLKRLYGSKGRVGRVTALQHDSASLRWVGESKLRELPKWLVVAYEQIQSIAKRERKYPVLMLHIKGELTDSHILHVISREEHGELMQALKRSEELEYEVERLRKMLVGAQAVGGGVDGEEGT
jgi:hypothetical protein